MIDFNKITIVGKSGNLLLLAREADRKRKDTENVRASVIMFDGKEVVLASNYATIDLPLKFNAYEPLDDLQDEHLGLLVNQRIVDDISVSISNYLG